MKKLITLCAARPVAVLMLLAAIGIAAVFSCLRMSLEKLPELSFPCVLVETRYNGMTAADIRSLVTIPVEDALSPVKGLQRIRSVSRDNVSLVSLDFRWGSNVMTAAALVREAIDAVYPSLPQGIRRPVVTPQNSGHEAHSIVAVRSLTNDAGFARHLAEYELRARFRQIDGAGTVVLVGGETGEQRFRMDLPRLAARNMNPFNFIRLLSGETSDIPAGNAREGDREIVVVSSGRPSSVEELSRLVIPSAAGAFAISDAGTMQFESGRRESVFVADGQEAAALEIFRRPGADPVRLSRDIKRTVNEAASLFAKDVEITVVQDSSASLISGIGSLVISACLGAIAVIFILFVFIKRMRYSFLVALSIPLSVSAGVCVLALCGKSLNSMSLGGLALGIGLVSDLSVIVIDLLHRAFGTNRAAPSASEIAVQTVTISASSMASTITTAVVFVPLIFLPGPLGSLFGDMAIALVSSITAGWLYSQFCLTSLYKFFFKYNSQADAKNKNSAPKGSRLEKKYRALLAPLLRKPSCLIIAAVALSIAGTALLFSRPVVFFSPDQAQEVHVALAFPPGTVLERASGIACEISTMLMKVPGIVSVCGRAGAEDEDIGRRAVIDYSREEFILRCRLDKKSKAQRVMTAIQQALDDAQGLPSDTECKAYLPRDTTEILLGLSSEWSFSVKGKDLDETRYRSLLAREKLNGLAGALPMSIVSRPYGLRPELRLYPNREASSYLGINGAELAETLFAINEGIVATTLEIEGRPLDVRVAGEPLPEKYEPEFLLARTPLLNREGNTVYIGSLARIERREAQAALARLDRNDVVYLDVAPLPGNKLINSINKLSAVFPWFAKDNESVFHTYRNSLIINICLVLVLLYMTMGAQFESFLLPLILMLGIPFSLAGAGPALMLFNVNLDSGAVLGLITLFGLVVNNGLLLYEIGDQRIKAGFAPALAVYGGAAKRFKPVLITTVTTVIVLLPLVFIPLANTQKSMAAAMLGGILASTALSLFVLPPVLSRFFAWRKDNERR